MVEIREVKKSQPTFIKIRKLLVDNRSTIILVNSFSELKEFKSIENTQIFIKKRQKA